MRPESDVTLGETNRPLFRQLYIQWRSPHTFFLLALFFCLALGLPGLTRSVLQWRAQNLLQQDIYKVGKNLEVEFQKTMEEYLPDKLEWGREIMRKRLPSRFPEELLMSYDVAKVDVRYTNREQNQAVYRLPVAYYFLNQPRATFRWQPVTFHFELRNRQWVMIGDNWMTEDDLKFE
jgi:uncharacterized protein (DUF58 family)